MNKLLTLRFLAVLLLLFIGSRSQASISLGQNLQMVTDTGAQINEIQINLGERFAGDDFNYRVNIPYRFRNYSETSSLAFGLGDCSVTSGVLRHISAKIAGQDMVTLGEIASGFVIEVRVSSEEESEGSLVCRGSELRDLSTGRLVATVQIFGFFRRKPRWTTRFGHCGRELEFSFDQKVSSSNPRSPVDSHPEEIRLINAKNYPADTVYTAPRKCRIGKQSFDSDSLAIVINRREILDGSVWSVGCPCFHAVVMRVLESANMGDKSGSVVCEIPGALTYTY